MAPTNGAADPLSFDAAAPAYTTPSVSLNNIAVNTCQTNPALPALPTTSTVTITNAATGTFNFDPAPGMTGTCILKYQVTDTGKGSGGNQTSAQADITITHAGPVIWFVDPNRATDGNGTLSDTSAAVGPFKLLSSANAKLAGAGANQRVFVYTGTTTIGATEILQLQGGHWLIGQGTVAAGFDTLFGLTGGSAPPAGTFARPTINSNTTTANAARPTIRGTVSLKDSCVVQGVNIDVSAGATAGLTGSLLGGSSVIVIKDVNVTSAGGNAVDFSSSVATSAISYTTSDATNSPNILSSTTGTALRVASTTIGASGLNFRSITSNGGANNGIILDTTGATGSLTVTGNGGTCTNANTAGCSGGQIANKTGADSSTTQGTGIYLNSTLSPSFTRMWLHDFQNYGIRGSSVTGFTLANSVFTGVNGNNVAVGLEESSVFFNNLLGTSSITNSDIRGGRQRNVRIVNSSGTANDIVISNNTIRDTSTSAGGDDNLFIQADNTAIVTAHVTGNTFKNSFGDHFQANTLNSANMTIVFTGNFYTAADVAWALAELRRRHGDHR